MTGYDKLRRRCVQALDPSHVDAGGQPFPYAMVSAAEVLALLDKVERVEALADEWVADNLHDRWLKAQLRAALGDA
jgi:hypothetical protein